MLATDDHHHRNDVVIQQAVREREPANNYSIIEVEGSICADVSFKWQCNSYQTIIHWIEKITEYVMQ